MFLFVPQTIPDGFKRLEKCECFFLEDRILPVAFLEIVVGYLWSQMVNMVIPDISGKELQDPGQHDS